MLIEDLSQVPIIFKTGIRGIFLLLRKKEKEDEGGNSQRKAIKLISCHDEDWDKKVLELDSIRKTEIKYRNHRIYASVNSRCLHKSVFEFKSRQLENDRADTLQWINFYTDIQNGFFSCLMKFSNRNTSYFLIDCDSPEEYYKARLALPSDVLLFQYETKNGFHIITEAFNPRGFPSEINKDALMYIG